MRTFQAVGLLTAVVASLIGYYFLVDVGPTSSASAASSVGLMIMFTVAPALIISAVLIVPSSIALFWPQVRERNFFQGRFWFAIWGCNCVISSFYLFATAYIFLIWLKGGSGI